MVRTASDLQVEAPVAYLQVETPVTYLQGVEDLMKTCDDTESPAEESVSLASCITDTGSRSCNNSSNNTRNKQQQQLEQQRRNYHHFCSNINSDGNDTSSNTYSTSNDSNTGNSSSTDSSTGNSSSSDCNKKNHFDNCPDDNSFDNCLKNNNFDYCIKNNHINEGPKNINYKNGPKTNYLNDCLKTNNSDDSSKKNNLNSRPKSNNFDTCPKNNTFSNCNKNDKFSDCPTNTNLKKDIATASNSNPSADTNATLRHSFSEGTTRAPPKHICNNNKYCNHSSIKNLNSACCTLDSTRSKGSTSCGCAAPCSVPHTVRMLVLGAHGVGKSAAVVRFLTQRFIGEYHSAVDIVYRHVVRCGGREQLLEIIDTSAIPGECCIPCAEARTADCVLVLYSIAQHSTLLSAQLLLEAVLEVTQALHCPPPVALLGNKLDLHHCREVPREEGESTAERFSASFHEVSAAESSGDITHVFHHLVQRVNRNHCVRRSTTAPTAVECPSQEVSTSVCSTASPTTMRMLADLDNKETGSDRDSPVTVGFSRQNSCLNCGDRIRSHFEKSSRKNSSSSANEAVTFNTQKCSSIEEALNICKMEIFESNLSLENKPPKQDIRKRNKNAAQRKLSKPTQMPTGKSKNKKIKMNTSFKSLDTRLANTDSLLFLTSGTKCSSNHALITPNSANDDESMVKKLQWQNEPFHIREYLSRSVDQNLQKLDCLSEKIDKESKSVTFSDNAKPLTLLQRGRSFIQEAKDKHWSSRDLRLSFRNLNSKSETSKVDNPSSSESGSPLPVRPTRSYNGRRPKNLPTGGKTWVTRSDGEEEKSGFLNSFVISRTSSVSDRIETNNSSPAASSVHPRVLECGNGYRKRYEPDFPENNASARYRKLSVFSRTLGSFLSRSSMPDLPRATATLYDKFDSLKKSIKKRSV